MKILLIQPKSERSVMGQTSRHGKAGFVRLSLPSVAALTPPDVEVQIVDCRVQQIDYDVQVDLVGISLLTCEASFAYEVARKFRARDVPVVMGGYHPTLAPQDAGEHADAVVVGEAELVWEQVVEDCRNERLRSFYMADRLCDMDSDVKIPRRDLLDRSKYCTFNTIQATRGCSRGCNFCSVGAFFGHRYRTRAPENVVDEIKLMLPGRARSVNPWARRIYFVDDAITLDRDYAAKLFEALIPLKIKWGSQMATAIADNEDILALASRSGCRWASVGFESINPKNLRYLNKNWAALGFTGEDVVKQPREAIRAAFARTVETFHKHGISVFGNFIFGFDDDNPEILEETIDAALGIGIDGALFHIVTPFPGTKLHEQLDREHRIITRDWRRYDSGQVVFAPGQLFIDELQDYFWQAYERFYSVGRIVRRFLFQPGDRCVRLVMNNSTRRKVKRMLKDKESQRQATLKVHQDWFAHYAELHRAYGKWAEVKEVMDRVRDEIRRVDATIKEAHTAQAGSAPFERVRAAAADLGVRLPRLVELLNKVHESGPARAETLQSGKVAMLKRVASGLSHELKGSLSDVMNGIKEVRKAIRRTLVPQGEATDVAAEPREPSRESAGGAPLWDQALDNIESCLASAERIEAWVDRFRNLAGLNALEVGPMDLEATIDSVVQPMQRKYDGRIVIKREYAPVGQIVCDVARMQQVFENLVRNACEAIKKDGRVTIRTAEGQDGAVEIAVTDTGCGIPDDLLDDIFDPFFTTKDVGEGDGFGLAMCKGTVENHAGSITATSTVGKGTTMTIVLPREDHGNG